MALAEIPEWRRWAGRSRRLEFWICVAALYVADLGLILATKLPLVVSSLALLVWLFIATRRLNDMRGRWWLAWLPGGTGFVGGFIVGFLRTSSHGSILIPQPYVQLASVLVTIATTIYLGSAPSKRAADEPPPGTLAVDLSTFD
jgi:uncharacterized membrane protein YhaH (DUF805 family)